MDGTRRPDPLGAVLRVSERFDFIDQPIHDDICKALYGRSAPILLKNREVREEDGVLSRLERL